jgi:hypothetical protein
MSGLSRIPVVPRLGSEGQNLAEAVEEVWLGARSGPALDGSNGVFRSEPIG